jgi:hypothetical protein
MFFDGSSLVAYVFSIALYLSVVIPSLRTIATPLEGIETREVRIEAMKVLSAGNVIMIVGLLGILVLQAGQEYALRVEARELSKLREKTE